MIKYPKHGPANIAILPHVINCYLLFAICNLHGSSHFRPFLSLSLSFFLLQPSAQVVTLPTALCHTHPLAHVSIHHHLITLSLPFSLLVRSLYHFLSLRHSAVCTTELVRLKSMMVIYCQRVDFC